MHATCAQWPTRPACDSTHPRQINNTLNTLGLAHGARMSSLTSLTLLNLGRAGHREALIAAIDSLPTLARLEVELDDLRAFFPWPATAKDAAGRPLVLSSTPGQCRWVLQRSLAPAPAAAEM